MPRPKLAATRRKHSNGIVVQVQHGTAVGFPMGGVDRGFGRRWIVVRRGEIFFHQRAEDADFNFAEDLHGGKSYSTSELRIR
jgi:hypothetical protein